jgi:predicted metal-dependent hydrolase
MSLVASRTVIEGREVAYRLRAAKSTRRLRVRVSPHGVDVIAPKDCEAVDAETFLQAHGEWVIAQIDRMQRLASARRARRVDTGSILLRGEPTRVFVEESSRPRRSNALIFDDGSVTIATGPATRTSAAKTLERWLRAQARADIEMHLADVVTRLGVHPGRIYVMDQRTKWGNCSKLRNLSFNWRMVMAPEHVRRYLVTHEAVHLAIPDHSQKFWLTVQSICPETERARQWLVANRDALFVDLAIVTAAAR